MFVYLLRVLGVAPERSGKTGKREAAWMAVAVTLAVTIYAMAGGPEMARAMSAVLLVMWPSSFALLAGAYKLEFDKASMSGQSIAPSPSGPPAEWSDGAGEGMVG